MKSKGDCAPMTTFEITLHLCGKQNAEADWNHIPCPPGQSVRCHDSQSLHTRWKPWHFYVCLFSLLPLCSLFDFLFLLYQSGHREPGGVGENCEEQLLSKSISDTGQAWQGLKYHILRQAFCTGSWIEVSYPTSLIPSCSSRQPCTCFVAITLHLRAANNGCLLPAGLVLIFSQALLKKRNFWNDYGL